MQYTFSLPLPPVFSEDNYIVSPCNREAWQWVNSWPKWPATAGGHALLLHGPAGCGKSHLGYIWAKRAKATIIQASAVQDIEPAGGNYLIENIEAINNERALLHLYNAALEGGGNLLLTSSAPISAISISLPDLRSRLLALPSVGISQPDDEVLSGALRKQLTDRQMKVEEDVISYIVPRVERSFAEINILVERLDRLALAEHKNITIPLAKRVLDETSAD